MTENQSVFPKYLERRSFIGGSDARIIMGDDEPALIRLWREKRAELEPEDLSGNLIVQLGVVTEALNRLWYERNTGRTITDVQRRIRHPVNRWLSATLDGMVEATGAVFEAKFMLPWSFSEETAAEKHMAQLQHNMWVTNTKTAALSIITGGGKWVEITIPADALYQHLLLTAERKFWRCVETGEPPRLFTLEPPRPRIEAVRIVDMSGSNSWAEFAEVFRSTRSAFIEHERAKAELKALMPEDAKEAIGHGLRAKRSRSGAVSFELFVGEDGHAAVQSHDRGDRGRAGQGAGRAYQPRKIADRHHSLAVSAGGGQDVPLCPTLERARHRAQVIGPARDCHRADDGDRQRGGGHPTDHGSCPFVGGMGVIGLAGLPDQRHRGAPPNGGGAHLRPPVCPVHSGGDCRRRRP
jgi:predicted phage-related endonuclease